jgi:FAD/FMN-containing dehydrogenase
MTTETIKTTKVQEFAASLRGQLIQPEDDAYEDARKVWNAMSDKHPALIARCSGVADVIDCVNFARDNGMLVSVRGGGHNAAGSAVCDGGLVIDLSEMKGIHVDPKGRTARAEGGATWGALDRETQAFGLATVGGTVSMTGIGGLTLGGGVGWLMRKHGLACDNLVSVDVVTADGRFVTTSSHENEDLFWGVRGGGGNFGIVTSFEYRLHPVGPVVAKLAIHPLEKGREALRFYRDFTSTAPEELTTFAGVIVAPDGNPAVALIACYAGPVNEGERVLQPLREFGPPAELIEMERYIDLQTAFDQDPSSQDGAYNYLKSDFLTGLSDEAIDVIIEHCARVTSPASIAFLEHMGGAIRRLNNDDTAFNQREADFNFVAWACWPDPAENEKHIAWTREFSAAMEPFKTGGVYLNYMGEEGDERVKAAYGDTYGRLAALKNKYDPTNFFRMNQNIKPVQSGAEGPAV